MFGNIYTVFFVVSALQIAVLAFLFKNRISIFYYLMFVCVMLTNFGYMQVSVANTLDEALQGNQVVYLGSSFSAFCLLMCVADLCKVHIDREIQYILLTLESAIFILASTTQTSTLFYKKVHVESHLGMTFLGKEYGPLHALQPFNLLFIMAMCIVIIVKCFKRRKVVSYRTSAWISGILALIIITYFGERILNIRIELIPISYMICEFVMIMLLRRVSLFDVAKLSSELLYDSNRFGYVLYDENEHFLGADEAAKEWFPELNEQVIDRPLVKRDTPLISQLLKWSKLEKADETDRPTYNVGDLIIEAHHSILKANRTNMVHCVHLLDDTSDKEYHKLLEGYNGKLEEEVDKKTERLRKMLLDITTSMGSIVENRDSNTGGHVARTSDVVNIFVTHLLEEGTYEDLDAKTGERIRRAAPLHDFGKIAIPDSILNKPGKFEDWEYEIMKTHAEKGAKVVEQILWHSDNEKFKAIAKNVANYHHEKWDGRGYPVGLKGEEIPFEARVMALADVFDALVSKRVYKDSYDYEKAFRIIEESCGTHFDPVLCKEFLHCKDKLIELYDSYDD